MAEDPTGGSNEETEGQGQEEGQSSEAKIMLVVEVRGVWHMQVEWERICRCNTKSSAPAPFHDLQCKKGQLKLRMGSHDGFGKMFDAFVSAARNKVCWLFSFCYVVRNPTRTNAHS